MGDALSRRAFNLHLIVSIVYQAQGETADNH